MDIKKEVKKFLEVYTSEKIEKQINFLEKVFDGSSNDYISFYNEFDETFSLKEKNYIKIFGDYFIEIEKNLDDLKNSFCELVKSKNYKVSMYLLRGFIELLLFNIYTSHKLFNHFNKQDYENFFSLFVKANYGHKQFSLKSYELIIYNDVYKKVFTKAYGDKIHVNNCLDFYSKTDFYLRFKETKKMSHFLNFKDKNIKLRDSFYNFIEKSIKEKDQNLEQIYFQLCEIIHPTSIILNSYDDEITNANYRSIISEFISSPIIATSVGSQYLNMNLMERITSDKENFTKEFELFLNTKKN